MIALPESFISYDHDYLLKRMVDEFKKKYGVECFAALHHNKRKTISVQKTIRQYSRKGKRYHFL